MIRRHGRTQSQHAGRLADRPAWWGRLELRVVAALVVLGIICVGASVYLVRLTAAYFDDRVVDALEQARTVADDVEPLYGAVVDAQISAFEARAERLSAKVAGVAAQDPDAVRPTLQDLLAQQADLMQLSWRTPGLDPVQAVRPITASVDALQLFEVDAGPLRVAFAIDPAIDARYQALGQRKRDIGAERESAQRVERAVTQALGLASALVLLVAIAIGFWVARSMTRKVTELSAVMSRVGHGEFSARARPRGADELSQLAQAFNGMLDELVAAQQKVAYLQRIGAWQGMARRIAHEIKNPLTPIQLAVQQLRDKDPGTSPRFSAMLKTSVEIIEDEVEGLRRMVASFSQFAKVPEVRTEPTTVQRVLAEFSRAYGHLTEERGEELEVASPTEPLAIAADRQLLKQALVNLVENAVLSAREAERAVVEVRVAAAEEDGRVRIVVDDNGPGIDKARRDVVFEPYETTRRSGTGLGLAIVKKIVLDHGGEIWVEDSPLGGARFVITLPLGTAAA